MSKPDDLFTAQDVPINNIVCGVKRSRTFQTKDQNSQTNKRMKEDLIDEVEIRDKLLEELSSNVSSRDSENLDVNQQTRKIIKVKGTLPNLALPEGWMALNHRSGGIIYLHRATRVCTWARPYYLGKGSVRKHDVPIAAIPCLHQSKALLSDKQEAQKQSTSCIQTHTSKHTSVLNLLNTAGSDDYQINDTIQTAQVSNALVNDNSEGIMNHMENSNVESIDSTIENIDQDRIGRAGARNNQMVDKDDTTQTAQASNALVNDSEGILNHIETGSCHVAKLHSTIHNIDQDNKQMVDKDDTTQTAQISNALVSDNNEGIMNHCVNKTVESIDSTLHNVDQDNGSSQECVDNAKNVSDSFHPKDGLDVVNFTLEEDGDKEIDSSSLTLRSEQLNKTQQNTSFKSNFNRELYNGFCSSMQEENILHEMPQSLKGSEKTNSNITELKTDTTEIAKANVVTSKEQSDGSLISKSSVNVFPVGTNVSKYDLKNGIDFLITHNATGIELIEANSLSCYLSKLFEFEELTAEQEQNVVQPSEPTDEDVDPTLASALECLPYCVKGKNTKENKGWVLNPGGKTPVAILHEYCQAKIKEKPVYVHSECGNNSTPFMVEVHINGITHGTGAASNKKQAKQIAAEMALEVLMPNEYSKIRDHVISREELECFDKLKIDSPNIYDVSIKSGLPTPSQVLQECLKRNQGVCSSTIHFKIVPGEYQNHTFTISCGKHSAEGKCKNKKIGKQLASQALLMKLHPYISTWGSLLRIYCDRPSSIVKKYKTPDEESLSYCTSTPDATRGEALLARLKEEMLKIADHGHQGLKYAPRADDTSSIRTVDV